MFDKPPIAKLTYEVSDAVGLGWGVRTCIPCKFPEAVAPTVQRPLEQG